MVTATPTVRERVMLKLKDPDWNIRFRRYVYRRGARDVRFAAAMRRICREDILFWINVFIWTYDPRREPQARLPMITYGYQGVAILELVTAVSSGNDRLIEKSRDMGASWICILVFMWFWQFRRLQSFLLVSRNEKYVDDKGNSKSLFWKIDFALQHMPVWFRPKTERTKMHIENLENSSVLDGESTTGRVARGDRRTAVMLDEFAAVDQGYAVLSSTRDVTRCRIFNSTHEGTGTAYYDISRTEIIKLRMHWSEHPLKSYGLYTRRNEKYVFIDADYWARQDDPEAIVRELDIRIARHGVPIPDGKLRSPWYAEQCERTAHAVEIAQELDIDPLGSSYQFFSAVSIEDHIERHCAVPSRVGEILYDPESLVPSGWRDNPRGLFKLWMNLDGRGFPLSQNDVTLGGDVSAGSGASNSALSAIDKLSFEKVLEYANPLIGPEAFGRLAVVTARWLGNAKLIWEQSGPGRPFGDAVTKDAGYSYVYYRANEEKVLPQMTFIPGWVPTKDNKLALLSEWRRALEMQTVINRSEPSLREALEYVHLPNQTVEHARAANSIDPTGARKNHGDRVIADALAWKLAKGKTVAAKRKEPGIPPPGSFGHRRLMRRKQTSGRQTMWSG